VYAVDDLQVPPPSFSFNGMDMNLGIPGGLRGTVGTDVLERVHHNTLRALDISSGKMKWELGGGPPPNGNKELDDGYFLGPPLPLGGKLYVLLERQQELRLLCIDPALRGKIEASQTLATTKEKLQADVARRTEAAHLAYSEGILVCPTNAGAILGVDLLSNSLIWAYPYREKTETEEWNPQERMIRRGWAAPPDDQNFGANLRQQWKVSAPVIVEGKVIFTAPDARAIHCINLRDGAPVWKRQRAEDDQYLAGVFAGRVVIVGKKTIRALALATGEKMWELTTGMPSGQGVASDNIYYLPLAEAGELKEPEICAIDIVHGKIIAHTKSRKREVPG
ncbi:MAG: PQQ-binding-like beta-propeller repeat protein, partial [Candidatus Acidiferrum sp.]